MGTVIKIILISLLVLFLLSGVLAVLGTLLGLTLGLVGAIAGLAWEIVSSPVILILIIIFLAYKLNKTATCK